MNLREGKRGHRPAFSLLIVVSALNAVVLFFRIRSEERVQCTLPGHAATMAPRKRFLPGAFRCVDAGRASASSSAQPLGYFAVARAPRYALAEKRRPAIVRQSG